MNIRFLTLGALSAMALAVNPGISHGEYSNRNDVRANLENGWSVVWGKNFTEADWARGTAAIAESIAAENPGPFLAWFDQTLSENFSKIEANLPGVVREDLKRWIVQSLKQKTIVRHEGFEIQAGFATYNRWQRIVYGEPRTGRRKLKGPFGTWTYVPYAYIEQVEKQVPLPNWNQFYVRYKLVAGHQVNLPTNPVPPPTNIPTQAARKSFDIPVDSKSITGLIFPQRARLIAIEGTWSVNAQNHAPVSAEIGHVGNNVLEQFAGFKQIKELPFGVILTKRKHLDQAYQQLKVGHIFEPGEQNDTLFTINDTALTDNNGTIVLKCEIIP